MSDADDLERSVEVTGRAVPSVGSHEVERAREAFLGAARELGLAGHPAFELTAELYPARDTRDQGYCMVYVRVILPLAEGEDFPTVVDTYSGLDPSLCGEPLLVRYYLARMVRKLADHARREGRRWPEGLAEQPHIGRSGARPQNRNIPPEQGEGAPA